MAANTVAAEPPPTPVFVPVPQALNEAIAALEGQHDALLTCGCTGCIDARWVSPTGHVTTRCVFHNIKQYNSNIKTGANQLGRLCTAMPGRFAMIDGDLSAAIRHLKMKRRELRDQFGPHNQ
jgi:hypothetical protein